MSGEADGARAGGQDGSDGPGFVHLRVRSAYSLLEGALPIARLAKLAAADAMPALAITDTGNLFGALEFSAKLSETGVQPIVGCTLALDMGEGEAGAGAIRARAAHRHSHPAIALIATNETGYANLMALSSRAYLETDSAERPHITLDMLSAHNDGLILLTGGAEGPLGAAVLERGEEAGRACLETLAGLFPGRAYVELQRHGADAEQICEPVFLDLAYGLGLPVVATNDAYFPTREDFEAHDALICVSEGALVSQQDRRRLTPEHCFKSRAEMCALFADLPEALASSVEIARRCAFWPRPAAPMLPRFAGGEADEAAELRRAAEEGLRALLAVRGVAPGHSEQDYRERLDFELGVIERMRYAGYFLIVSDFIKWAKSRSIPVGPGRGSGAGSVVAWSLSITDLDPIRFGLLFERFLNPERVSMPDFDIDFCQEGRDDVIRYVQERYGEAQVAQIITFGTLQARAVLRDVGRVLEMSYGEVDRICKLVPYNPAKPVTLSQAIEDEPRLRQMREENPAVERLLRISLRLEGLYRHASTHAAGIVIGDRPLGQIVPIYRDPRSTIQVTQFNMKWVEQAGLVKFDFLGLKTLTVLENTVRLLAEKGVALDLAGLPLDDPGAYEMMSRGETMGVFQLESSGMRDALKRMKPDRFEDIIALVALYRPGPMDNIPTYCSCKHGLEKPNFLHPKLKPILDETYGVIIYQEQVMEIAQVMSGYSLGEADLLRRAMGKKIKSEMDKQRARFIDGAVANGVARDQAEYVFELVAKFADYGFNKSHAAAYALIAYQTAYLKANHPVEFLAASMTCDIGNAEKLSQFRREAQRIGITVAPPSINRSGVAFMPSADTILYSLAAVRNVGRQAVEHIVEVREAGGPFSGIGDFAGRINPRLINRRALESLAAAGAFDELDGNRAAIVAGAELILATAGRASENRGQGQADFFSLGGSGEVALALPDMEPWLGMERLTREFDAIGFFLSGHPLDDYGPALKRMNVMRWADFHEAVIQRRASAAKLAGIVTARQEKRGRNGSRYAFLALSDASGQYEAMVFSDTLSEARDLLEPGNPVLVSLEADNRDGEIRLRVQKVEALDRAAERSSASGLRVFVEPAFPVEGLVRRLPGEGRGGVNLVLFSDQGRREVEIALPGRYQVTPQVAGSIKSLPGVIDVHEL